MRPLARLRGVVAGPVERVRELRAVWRRRAELLELSRRGPDGFATALCLGSVADDEAQLLRELVRETDRHPGPIVEVGTLFGLTTLRLATWSAPGKRIVSVDNYAWNPLGIGPTAHRAVTRSILGHLVESGRLMLVDADKHEFYASYADGPPALAFLDAVHTMESTQADLAWARHAGTAVVCGHDYSPRFPGVMAAVDAVGGPARLRGTLWSLV